MILLLQGRDTETGRYFECRIAAQVLIERYAATKGPEEALDVFNQHRPEIEAAAQRKYTAGPVEDGPDGRAIFYLDAGDF